MDNCWVGRKVHKHIRWVWAKGKIYIFPQRARACSSRVPRTGRGCDEMKPINLYDFIDLLEYLTDRIGYKIVIFISKLIFS